MAGYGHTLRNLLGRSSVAPRIDTVAEQIKDNSFWRAWPKSRQPQTRRSQPVACITRRRRLGDATMTRITKMLADTTSRMLFRKAEVTVVTDHGVNFRVIELAGEALRRATWTVGDKAQLRTDPAGLTTRTYTPIGWDAARGSTALLAYTHGTGPGSTWARGLAPGDSCQMFGPRGSLKLDDLAGPIVFVGDETSFALVAAWCGRNPGIRPVAELFEVTDPDESRLCLDAIGLQSARLFHRQTSSAHLEVLATTVIDLLRTHPDASLCLTGKAQSIAAIRRELKTSDLAGRPTRVKAYWDENRSGLD